MLFRRALNLVPLQGAEAVVISVTLEEKHHARDVVVHVASRRSLGNFLQLLHAEPMVLRRLLQHTLREGISNRQDGAGDGVGKRQAGPRL